MQPRTLAFGAAPSRATPPPPGSARAVCVRRVPAERQHRHEQRLGGPPLAAAAYSRQAASTAGSSRSGNLRVSTVVRCPEAVPTSPDLAHDVRGRPRRHAYFVVSHPLEEFVSIHHSRKGALLVGLALVLTASPAAASNVATDTADSAQPSSGKRLAVTSSINAPGTGPVRPGEEVALGLFVRNDGEQAENFVLTVTLPPEQTLISLEGMGVRCSGTVCTGGVAPGPDPSAPDNVRQVQLRTRLSSSFRGDTTTIRTDLQEDANPDSGSRTNLSAFNVQQPASGAARASSGTILVTRHCAGLRPAQIAMPVSSVSTWHRCRPSPPTT